MKRRAEQEWLALFKQHEQSGLSAAEFCRKHQLNAKYFSKRQFDLNWKQSRKTANQSFIQVKRPELNLSPSSIQLTIGQTQLYLPQSIDANWLAILVKALT
ncbi:IS66 family insertion sequence element accessory protein TnpA [Aliikangiella sp. IMCC44359]|uniref:IS66 family insertion sequence element accessory protein TnpA n=1 Tax=Aliikangiella sp. IMCC44359 TaxID=3459125 RepID=UPI00403AAC9E